MSHPCRRAWACRGKTSAQKGRGPVCNAISPIPDWCYAIASAPAPPARWAEATNSFIIEDDYDSDFRYDGPPLTTLAGTRSQSSRSLSRHVFQITRRRSSSRLCGSSQRTFESARVVKSHMNSGEPWLEQAVLAEFLKSGLFDRHLRRIRQTYKARRDCLRASLERHFGPADIYGADGGLHIVWRLPPGSPPAYIVERAARKESIGVYALNKWRRLRFDRSSSCDFLVFGYSSLPEKDIEHAVRSLHAILNALRSRFCENLKHENEMFEEDRFPAQRYPRIPATAQRM